MQRPSVEIQAVIKMAHSSASPDIQKAAINKYFTSDAGLRHPLYNVKPGFLSREGVLGIYQWERALAPKIDVDIRDTFKVFDRLRGMVYVDLSLLLHVRLSPFKPVPFRTMSRYTLRMIDGLHYICMQEDFAHPDDMAALILPPFTPMIKSLLSLNTMVSIVWGKWAQVFGVWRAPLGVDHVPSQDIATIPARRRSGESRLRQKERREHNRSIRRTPPLTPPELEDSTFVGDDSYNADFDIFEREPFIIEPEEGIANWFRPPETVLDRPLLRTNGKRFSDDLRSMTAFASFVVPPEDTPGSPKK
ncbi:hypothetical protein JR316_0012460 [Psilocybe cubensis]|uniref:SigF-like NTF2-like domain-containing protein n=2 Tax=Psilocybe cubensis TaxID=181762 RepID=A0A8H8CF92_PSICU|nr:hypothetical protein JR316_0012460 [Psilocybe cubensis]KAH9475349.1 hypothetical protein JR316_0012460 [Psilocybe cubensis]